MGPQAQRGTPGWGVPGQCWAVPVTRNPTTGPQAEDLNPLCCSPEASVSNRFDQFSSRAACRLELATFKYNSSRTAPGSARARPGAAE